MKLNIQKAKREQVYAKILIGGASGSGKSYSALTLAKGMSDEIEAKTGKKPNTIMLSTEGDRSLLYADIFDYDYAELPDPFTPEALIECLADLEEAGYEIIILDSLSAFWSGKGGILQIVQAMGNNSIQAWSKATPRFNQMMNAIVRANAHIIACVRGKDTWKIDKDESSGKTSVQKLAEGLDFRANADYEFMMSFMLDLKSHSASVSKDNTRLFESLIRPLTEADGASIIKWCSDGATPKEKVKPIGSAESKAEREKLFTNTMESIKAIAKEMKDNGTANIYLEEAAKVIPSGKVSTCTIEDLPAMIRLLDTLKNINRPIDG